MRLNRFNPNSVNVRAGGGGGRFPGGGGGKVGCGTIVIALIIGVVFGPEALMNFAGGGGMQQGQTTQQSVGGQNAEEICTSNQYALETCNALGSLNETWEPVFAAARVRFNRPTLTFMAGQQSTGCGTASSAMGPFYCPADEGIYIDTRFYQTMERQLGAGGDFARYYVIAHEYGHHIQKLTGVAGRIRKMQQQRPNASNQLQVLMELQADCYAGVWAGKNRNLIEPGDMQEGLRAAASIGDDTLQRNAGQRVNPEGFTHGTSEQRMQALRLGMTTGNYRECNRIVEVE